ncbi:hypothetical protein AHAS_Ahas16G0297200 [Arachis hypogaea]
MITCVFYVINLLKLLFNCLLVVSSLGRCGVLGCSFLEGYGLFQVRSSNTIKVGWIYQRKRWNGSGGWLVFLAVI